MKTIFAKYNSERLPKYQIVTKIVMDENGKRYALKEPLNDEAKEHIEDIYNHYGLLKSAYDINLVKPTKTDNGILFEMAEGEPLEKILLEAISANNHEAFQRYIEKFLDFVDGMVTKRDVIFEPSKEFVDIFGAWEMDEPQDIIKLVNIDVIFGNIFVDANDTFALIDYEWVFDFEIPKSYIIWRSLAIFSAYHAIKLDRFFTPFMIANYVKLLELNKKFGDFVNGENKKYFLTERAKKPIHFLNLENKPTSLDEKYFIQLFFDHGNGFTEESSLKLPVAQNTDIQEFVFDLSDRQPIHSLRLDPLNDSCVVEIESIRLVKTNEEQELTTRISSNSSTHHGKSYFFQTDDPIIFFEGLSKEELYTVQKLRVSIRFAHIGKDALQVCVKQTKTELDQTKAELDQTKAELDQTKAELDQTKAELDQTKAELVGLYTNESWKITQPLKHLFRFMQQRKRLGK